MNSDKIKGIIKEHLMVDEKKTIFIGKSNPAITVDDSKIKKLSTKDKPTNNIC